MKRISNVVPVRITADFHAAKEISSDLMAVLLSCSVDISAVKDVYYINFVANDHLVVSPTTTNNSLFATHYISNETS